MNNQNDVVQVQTVMSIGLINFANKPKEVLGDELQKWKGHSSP